ncbi:Ig-like domain-containing protein [Candidatus Entotheonella palauensis]|uniref:Ig-like domain-containing protein n=1 Tax=Candidatus Entotheonella palauensis TaxID=93172 RepID=UPI000B7D596B|nr:hypothetical protein [Candidatus Entotheonella palauensis]
MARQREQHAIQLEDDGRLPHRVVFAVALVDETIDDALPLTQEGPPRAPDEEDLLNSPESFSSDLGGGHCADFTAPNRTLEEFTFYKIVRTTDPDIKGTHFVPPLKLPADFEIWLKKLAFGQDTIDSQLKVRQSVGWSTGAAPADQLSAGRRLASDAVAALPVRAEHHEAVSKAAHTVPKLPTLDALEAYGVKAVAQWRGVLDEKSIDEALTKPDFSLSAESLRTVLADPDGFTPMSLMTAERLATYQLLKDLLRVYRKQAAGRALLDDKNRVDWDDTPTFYQATTIAHGHLLQFREVWKADGYSLGDLVHSIPLAPCQKKQVVVIDWDRREDATRTEALTERERLFADLLRDRDIKEIIDTALTEDLEGGSTAKTYGGGGGFGFAIGPLVIGGGGGASGADATAWQDSSRVLSATTMHELRDRINQSAAAVRSQRATVVQTLGQGERMRIETEVIANHNHCHALTVQYFEVLRHFQILEELAEVRECLFVPFLMSRFDDTKTLKWREALARYIRKRKLRRGFDAIERIQLNYAGTRFPVGSYAEEPLEALDGELEIRLTVARPRDPEEDEAGYFLKAWHFWPLLIGGNPADIYDLHLRNQQFKDRIFQQMLAPQIAEAFIGALRVVLIDEDGGEIDANLDPTLVSKYRAGATHKVTLADSGNTPTIARKDIVAVELRTDHELPEHSKVIVEKARFDYRTPHLRHHLYAHSRVLDDLMHDDPVYLSTTDLSRREARNPRAEDRELRRQLLAHLNANIEYYHKVIWWGLDKERRFMLLDGFIAPNSGNRSVASVVENELIGIIGNSLVFPVAPGFQLDPRYRQVRDESCDEAAIPNLFDLYAPLTPNPPRPLSVPTKGVFAEAMMGACNSCEQIDDSRFWRWSESPCPDEPPRIAEVSAASRVSETPDLTPQDFPTPIVNYQAIPQAPDPTGLRAALDLIGSGDIFRDITGLTQNQRNALATLQTSLSTAQAFGKEAIQLAHARAAQRSIDQTLKSVEQAKKDGRLTGEAARDVTKKALQALIGEHGEEDGSFTDSDVVKDQVESVRDAKKSKVQFSDASAGTQQTVEISQEGGPGPEGQAAAALRLAGPISVVRGANARYEVINAPNDATFSDWTFFVPGGVMIHRPGNNNHPNWGGIMVQSGMITVTMSSPTLGIGGGPTRMLSLHVTVTPRNWTEDAPAIPLPRTELNPALFHPANRQRVNEMNRPDPRDDRHIGHTFRNFQLHPTGRVGTVPDGPNENFHFLTDPPVRWVPLVTTHPALYDATHPFFRAHDPDLRGSPLPPGRPTIAQLQADVEAHEGLRLPPPEAPANWPGSHWQRSLDFLRQNPINGLLESHVIHSSQQTRQAYTASVGNIINNGTTAVRNAAEDYGDGQQHPPRLFPIDVYYYYPYIHQRELILSVVDPAFQLIVTDERGGRTVWSSSDENVATVNAGLVTPVNPGNTTIRVENADQEADEISVFVVV